MTDIKPALKSQHPDFNPDGSELRKLQLGILDILVIVDKICRKHRLRYCLSSGTLLGAVRHAGFIPWDDDIDIEMPIEDYNQLLKILPHELPPHLQLQTPETDSGYFFTYAKVRNKNTRIEELTTYERIFQQRGIYIDIFPTLRRNRFLHWVSNRTLGRCYVAMKNPKNNDEDCRRKVRRILWWNQRVIYPILHALSKILPCEIGYQFGIPFSSTRRPDYLSQPTEILFEGHSFLAPNNPHAYLTAMFGDYMQLPNLSDVNPHIQKVTYL